MTAKEALHDFSNCIGENSALCQLLRSLGTAKAGAGGFAAPQALQLLRGAPGFHTSPGYSELW